LPSTTDLTSTILQGEGFARHSQGTYYRGLPTPTDDRLIVDQILQFLKVLHERLQEYFTSQLGRLVNYEDIYYACSQLLGHESGNLENPLLIPFIRDLLPSVSRPFEHHDAELMGLYHLAEETANYIADVLAADLSRPVDSTASFDFIRDACACTNLASINIFTLNHDIILEHVLRTNAVTFVDGFGEPVHGVRYWNPNLFEESLAKVNLFKLHGSLNWYRLRPDKGHWHDEEVGIPLDGDYYHATARDGKQRMWPPDGRPLLLIGTFNKMFEYTGDLFLDLFGAFRRRLRECNQLVICGYGFGDKGINSQIVNWFYECRGRSICVVHPDPASLAACARGAIRNKWAAWLAEGALRIIPMPAECTTFEAVQAAFSKGFS
jgi:hypothetical protein